MRVNDIKKYRKKDIYSYSFGSFPTFELLQNRPEILECILAHSDASAEIQDKLEQECGRAGVKIVYNDRIDEKVRDKDNCVIVGVFRKYICALDHNENHVVLVHPGDAGNLGTIIRCCVGFGIANLAVIEPAVDLFHPKVIRASMGAIFKMKFACFPHFGVYNQEFGEERESYPFMLSGAYPLGSFKHPENRAFSLIFGNEASGLDAGFRAVGKSVVIPHARTIDSLNLSLATGIGLYEFCGKRQWEAGGELSAESCRKDV